MAQFGDLTARQIRAIAGWDCTQSIVANLKRIGVNRSTFYRWRKMPAWESAVEAKAQATVKQATKKIQQAAELASDVIIYALRAERDTWKAICNDFDDGRAPLVLAKGETMPTATITAAMNVTKGLHILSRRMEVGTDAADLEALRQILDTIQGRPGNTGVGSEAPRPGNPDEILLELVPPSGAGRLPPGEPGDGAASANGGGLRKNGSTGG